MNQFLKSMSRYNLSHCFQPIYNIKNNNIIGYEALLRDSSEFQVSPECIFNEADKNGYRSLLDKITIKKALDTFKNKSSPLFINVFPSTLLERDFLSWWDNNVPFHMNIVVELLENDSIKSWDAFKTITMELQKRNIKIAIDDMSEGYSFFQQWIELDPDYIKLDRYFSVNLAANSKKQKALKGIIDLFCNSTEIIIEGIETEKDLEIAKILGISYAQGYLLGRPCSLENLISNI